MSAEAQKPGLPTLHHLNDSQSQRILWLLEELSIDYNLVLYERDKKIHQAPPSLANVQPLGKSPVLVTADGTRTISESSAIAAYLIKTYDTKEQFAASDWIRDEQLTSFAGTTMGFITIIELLLDLAAKQSPFPISFVLKKVRNVMQNSFTMPEMNKQLSWLEAELGDAEWFNGSRVGRADVMLSWPLDLIVHRNWIDIEKAYPKIGAWRVRIQERPAWKSALEKGNGYDLSKW